MGKQIKYNDGNKYFQESKNIRKGDNRNISPSGQLTIINK